MTETLWKLEGEKLLLKSSLWPFSFRFCWVLLNADGEIILVSGDRETNASWLWIHGTSIALGQIYVLATFLFSANRHIFKQFLNSLHSYKMKCENAWFEIRMNTTGVKNPQCQNPLFMPALLDIFTHTGLQSCPTLQFSCSAFVFSRLSNKLTNIIPGLGCCELYQKGKWMQSFNHTTVAANRWSE